MAVSRVRPYLIGAAVKAALQLPITYLNATVPPGSPFRLDYVMVSYFRTGSNPQTSPDLFYQLYDSRGVAMSPAPMSCALVSSPGGNGAKGASVKALPKWGILYEPLSVIRIEITGMDAGPVPATVSVTFMGMRDGMRA